MTILAQSRLRLEPNALALRQIGGWLKEATDLLEEKPPGLLSRAELAVHEACMNVVDHANLPEGSTLDLALVLSTRDLRVQITDSGEEFAITEVASPADHTLQERGYGVKIIRALVNDLTYRRVDSHNELELRIDLDEQQPRTDH